MLLNFYLDYTKMSECKDKKSLEMLQTFFAIHMQSRHCLTSDKHGLDEFFWSKQLLFTCCHILQCKLTFTDFVVAS